MATHTTHRTRIQPSGVGLVAVLTLASCGPEAPFVDETAQGSESLLVAGTSAGPFTFPSHIGARWNRLIKLNKRSAVVTDLDLSTLDSAEMTISAWILPEYSHNDAGAIFGSTTGSLMVGQGDYRNGDFVAKSGTPGDHVLEVRVNGAVRRYLTPNYTKHVWHLITFVKRRRLDGRYLFELWLDGRRLRPFTKSGSAIAMASDLVLWPSASRLTGRLQIGRTAGSEAHHQFYGLVDDVAVYRRDLSLREIDNLRTVDLDGTQPWLLAAWNFDGYEHPQTRRATLQRTYSGTGHYLIPRSGGRNDLADAALLSNFWYVSPSQGQYILPFPPGQEWNVSQGFDDPGGSHNGYAAFCWDFIKHGGSAGAEVSAAADGLIVDVDDDKPPAGSDRNVVRAQIAPDERTTHMHLEVGSFADTFMAPRDLYFVPKFENPYHYQQQAGDVVGRLGAVSNHLHFCMNGSTEPIAFSGYFKSNDRVNWTYVIRGMPKTGEWIKR